MMETLIIIGYFLCVLVVSYIIVDLIAKAHRCMDKYLEGK